MQGHVFCEFLEGALAEHFEHLDAVYELFELEELLVDERGQKRKIFVSVDA